MNYPISRTALVIDNVDENKLGKIQVRVLPELNGVIEEDLPWIIPYNQSDQGTSNGVGKHDIPDIGAYIRVMIMDKYWQDIRYLHEGSNISGFYIYEEFEDVKIDEMEDPEYPQPKFAKTKDGIIKFHNTENGETGLIHPTGSYVFMDKNGDVFVKTINQVKIKNDDESVLFHIDIENATIQAKADSIIFGDGEDSLCKFTPLEKVLKKLIKHKHVAPSGLTLPAIDENQTPLSSLQSDISDIESDVSTTD